MIHEEMPNDTIDSLLVKYNLEPHTTAAIYGFVTLSSEKPLNIWYLLTLFKEISGLIMPNQVNLLEAEIISQPKWNLHILNINFSWDGVTAHQDVFMDTPGSILFHMEERSDL